MARGKTQISLTLEPMLLTTLFLQNDPLPWGKMAKLNGKTELEKMLEGDSHTHVYLSSPVSRVNANLTKKS